MRSWPVLLLSVLVLIPTASAATVVLRFDTPNTFRINFDGQQTGDAAQNTREQLDQDDDGQVTQEEVDQAEAMIKEFFGEIEGDDDISSESFSVDGKGPTTFSLPELDLRNAVGPTSSTDPIDVHAVLEMKFPIEPSDNHTVRVAGSDPGESDGFLDLDVTSAKLEAPRGYVIDSATGLPSGAKVSGDKKSIEFGGTYTSPEQMVIEFKKGGGGVPGLPLAGLLVAIIVALVFARRRRPFG